MGVDVDGAGKVVWAQLVEDWDDESSEHLYAVPDLDDVKDDDPEPEGADTPRGPSGEARAGCSPALGRCA